MKSLFPLLALLGVSFLSLPLSAQWTVDEFGEARGEIGITTFDGQLWLYGGDRQAGAPSTMLNIYDPAVDTFATFSPGFASTPGAELQSSDEYVLFYGEGFGLSNFGIYDAPNDQFRRENFFDSRFGTYPLLVDDKIYVAGGRGSSIDNPLDAIDVYDIPSDTWSRLDATLSVGRQEAQSILVGDSIYFVGGYTNINFNRLSARVDVFDLISNTITASFDMSIARFETGVFTDGERVIVAGGKRSNSFQYTDIVDVIDVRTNAITSTTLGRADLEMVGAFVGNELIMMGNVGTELDILDLTTLEVRQVDTGVSGSESSEKRAVALDDRVFFTLGDFSTASEIVVYNAGDGQLENYDTGTDQVGMRIGKLNNTVFVTSGYDRGDRIPYDEIYIYNRMPTSTRRLAVEVSVGMTPNPADRSTTVDLTAWGSGDLSLELFDATGRQLYQATIDGGRDRYELPLVDLRSGVYQVVVRGADRIGVGRLVRR